VKKEHLLQSYAITRGCCTTSSSFKRNVFLAETRERAIARKKRSRVFILLVYYDFII